MLQAVPRLALNRTCGACVKGSDAVGFSKGQPNAARGSLRITFVVERESALSLPGCRNLSYSDNASVRPNVFLGINLKFSGLNGKRLFFR